MAAKLIAEGILKGLVFELKNGSSWIIGRDPDSCDFVVEDSSVSRQHLRIYKTETGLMAENLSQTNPAQINSQPLLEPTLLENGDSIKIGNATFTLQEDKESTFEKAKEDMNELEPTEEEHTPEEDELQSTDVAKIDFDILEAGRWLLKIIGGPNHGAEFTMHTGKTYLLGTDPNLCDVILNDTSVSRQHARITINDDDTLQIEDLRSRNGTIIDGKPIEGKTLLSPNTIVTLGTSSFVIYDREGEMQTIISPLLPSIVKVLKEEPKSAEPSKEKMEEAPAAPLPPISVEKPKDTTTALGAFILVAILTGLFIILGIGLSTLFQSEPVQTTVPIDYEKEISDLFAHYPSLNFTYSKAHNRLTISGHILNEHEKGQLLSQLKNLHFIKTLDESGIINDELVWQETNQILSHNPEWRGISILAPTPGKFVVTGYLKTRRQADQLYSYLNINFPYPDLLSRNLVIEEDLSSQIANLLQQIGLRNITAQVNNGEVTLNGAIPSNQKNQLNEAITQIRSIPGVESIKSFITELTVETGFINISNLYEVTGSSQQSNGELSVMINNRILSTGDVLDGMVIREITPNTVILEKDRQFYKIDYQ